jgi:hypothetical protein
MRHRPISLLTHQQNVRLEIAGTISEEKTLEIIITVSVLQNNIK